MDLATVADEEEYAVLREYVRQYDRCMGKGIGFVTSMLFKFENEVNLICSLLVHRTRAR